MAFTGNYTTNAFILGLPSGSYNFATGTSDVYKIALYTNAATLNEDTAVYTATGEVPQSSAYTATGSVLTVSTVPIVTNDVAYWSFTNVSWSGAITARGALIYKVSGGTVCVLDFGNDKTSTTTFTVQFPTAASTSAIIRIS
jgi:hypothetical protein